MIQIVNWILTRRCNLRCDYCAIVRDYEDKPPEYPDMAHYHRNEMSTDYITEALLKLKHHNKDVFNIFYGGEPILRKDLIFIIDFCNKHNIHYTIISNNTKEVQTKMYDLFRSIQVKGFSGSCDPVLNFPVETDSDKKSFEALIQLKNVKCYVKDVVAEITIMQHNQHLLYEHVKKLSENGINSSITFIDVAKNPYYDFSNVRDESLLVSQNAVLAEQFQKLMDDSTLDIHMKDQLLPLTWQILPSNLDCKIEKNLHNISIDADGSVRLCLRIRGVAVPKFKINETFFAKNFSISTEVMEAIKQDKKNYCKLCNHTCQIMSLIVEKDIKNKHNLIHSEKRDDNTT